VSEPSQSTHALRKNDSGAGTSCGASFGLASGVALATSAPLKERKQSAARRVACGLEDEVRIFQNCQLVSLFLIEYNAWTDSTGFKLFLNDYNCSLICTIIPQSRQCVSTKNFDVGCKSRPQLSNRDFETTTDGPFWSGTVCRTQPAHPRVAPICSASGPSPVLNKEECTRYGTTTVSPTDACARRSSRCWSMVAGNCRRRS